MKKFFLAIFLMFSLISYASATDVGRAATPLHTGILGQVGHIDPYWMDSLLTSEHGVTAETITAIKNQITSEIRPSVVRMFASSQNSVLSFEDKFDRTDGDIGANYTKQGTWNIGTNEINKANAVDGDYAYYNGDTYTNQSITVRFEIPTGATGSPQIFAMKNGTDSYAVTFGAGTSGNVILYRNGTQIASGNATISNDVDYLGSFSIKNEPTGVAIGASALRIDTKQSYGIKYEDTSASRLTAAGYAGVAVAGTGNATPLRFDWLKVQAIGFYPGVATIIAPYGIEEHWQHYTGTRATQNYIALYEELIAHFQANGVDILLATNSSPANKTEYFYNNTRLVDLITWLRNTQGRTNVKYATPENEPNNAGWITPADYALVVSDLRTKLNAAGLTAVKIVGLDLVSMSTQANNTNLPLFMDNATIKANSDYYSIHNYTFNASSQLQHPYYMQYETRRVYSLWDDDPTRPALGVFEIGDADNVGVDQHLLKQWYTPEGGYFFSRAAINMILDGYISVGAYTIGPESPWEFAGDTISHQFRWGGLMWTDAATFYGSICGPTQTDPCAPWQRKPYWQTLRVLGGSLRSGADVYALEPSGGSDMPYPSFGFWTKTPGYTYVTAHQDPLAMVYYRVAGEDTTTVLNDKSGNTGAAIHLNDPEDTLVISATGGVQNGAYLTYPTWKVQTLSDTQRPHMWGLGKSWSVGCSLRKSGLPPDYSRGFQMYGSSQTSNWYFVMLTLSAASEGRPYFQFRRSNGTNKTIVPEAATGNIWDGNWHQVIATHDGYNTRIYIDGVQRALSQEAWSLYNPPYDEPISLGFAPGGGSQFNGNVDDCFVGRYLTASDAATLWNGGSPREFQYLIDNPPASPQATFAGFKANAELTRREWQHSDPFGYSETTVYADAQGKITSNLPWASIVSIEQVEANYVPTELYNPWNNQWNVPMTKKEEDIHENPVITSGLTFTFN